MERRKIIRQQKVDSFVDTVDVPPQMNERDHVAYEGALGFEVEKLEGLVVLNIGSGATGQFDKKAALAGADVFSLSPSFAETNKVGKRNLDGERMRAAYTTPLPRPMVQALMRRLLRKHDPLPTAVPGIAEDLPFEDSVFDVLVGLYSVPLYSEDYPQLFSEMMRVLREGGQGRFFPVVEEDKDNIDRILTELGVSDIHWSEYVDFDNTYKGRTTYRLVFTK